MGSKTVDDTFIVKEIHANTFAIEYIEANNLSVISTTKYAFYNSPWTLDPMSRNEVTIITKNYNEDFMDG